MRSSLVHTRSPWATASALILGHTAKSARTLMAGYGRAGATGATLFADSRCGTLVGLVTRS